MKNAVLFLVSLLFAVNAKAQLSGIVSEVYHDPSIHPFVLNYPEGFRTYRIYAELENPTDFVHSVFAVAGCHTLHIQTDGTVWNSPFGGTLGENLNFAFFGFFPELKYDSFATIGRGSSADPGSAVGIIASCPGPDIWSTALGASPAEGGFDLCDGAVYTLEGDVNGLPVGDNNRVLLFQITTNQDLSWCFNLQVYVEGDPEQEVRYVWDANQVGCGSPLEVDGSALGLCGHATGCNDPEAANYNPYLPGGGICHYLGCTDPEALNYDPIATQDNGYCMFTAPENITCPEAIMLNQGFYSAVGSNLEGDTESPPGSCWTDQNLDQGVWFSFTALASYYMLFPDFSEEPLDIAVYDACNGNEIACADGLLPGDNLEIQALDWQTVYYILLDSQEPGAFEFHIAPGYPGCMDPEASNFDPLAIIDDGTCLYEGCTDPEACNYDSDANDDDGSCFFSIPTTISGVFFIDANNNGIYEPGLDEITAPGMTLLIEETMEFVASDNFGYYTFEIPEDSSYTIHFFDDQISYNPGQGAVNIPVASTCNGNHPSVNIPILIVDIGCTNPDACNYNPLAAEDDGSCYLSDNTTVEGVAFFDMNGNGIFDGGEFGESTLFNRQILVHETGEILFTGPFGEFQFVVPAGETYHISLLDTDGAYDPGPLALDVPTPANCDRYLGDVNLPAVAESGLEALVGGPLDMQDFLCAEGFSPGIWINNTGATALDGVITMEFSNTLMVEPYQGPAVVAPDILFPGVAIWTFENQMPGEQFLYQCHIAGPGVDFIGTLYSFTITLVLIDENEEQVFFNSWTIEEELVCSYDPNDKAAVPQGYAEPHFILPNDEIDYRIRFQNTGNYPAETVVLVDTLDIQRLDIATFQPVVGSHPYTCSLLPDGTLTFHFDDIWLPDAESNEPESHGFISFRIRPIGGIDPNEVINNTAYIYFDSNPPIITNTTWHTIFDCSELELLGEPLPVCEGESLFVEVNYPYAEDFSWYINGEPEGDNLPGFFLDSPVSDMSLTLEASNPLCSGVSSSDIVVVENPTAEITQEGNVLSATPGMDSYQWFLNGSMIPGADQQTYAITASGEYSVAITDGNGCSSMSLPSIVVGIEAVQGTAVKLFPNPMEHSALLQFAREDAGRQMRITDLLGKQVIAWQNAPGMQFEIQRGSLRSGLYLIHVYGAGSSETMRLMIK